MLELKAPWLVISAALLGAAIGKLAPPHETAEPAICRDVPCSHLNEREAVIESAIAQQASQPVYLAIGDSHMERAILPDLCGYKPVNAGIGNATLNTFETYARRLAERARPGFIVVHLGTNDALRGRDAEFKASFSKLLEGLAPWPVLVLPLPAIPDAERVGRFNAMISELKVDLARPLTNIEATGDGVHLAAASYLQWKQILADAALEKICPADNMPKSPGL